MHFARFGMLLALAAPLHASSFAGISATTPAETKILQDLAANHVADVTKLPDAQKIVRFDFIRQVVRQSRNPVTIAGATITDADRTFNQDSSFSASVDLEFQNCNFSDGFGIEKGKFTNLSFNNSTLNSMFLNFLQVSGGLFIHGGSAGPNGIQIANSDVGAALSIETAQPSLVRLHNVNGRELSAYGFSRLDMENSTFATADLYADTRGSVYISQLSVKRIGIFGSQFQSMVCVHSAIDGLMDLRYDTIELLDLSFSNVAWFSTLQNQGNWPGKTVIEGTQFKSLEVAKGPIGPAGGHAISVDPLEFLVRAEYSAPAFTNYAQSLTDRGLLREANRTVFAMHSKWRSDQMACPANASFGNCAMAKTFALPLVVFDLFQQYVLGLGISVVAPLVCSLIIVGAGFYVFRSQNSMESNTNKDKGPAPYSCWWYSLELFLPVVDLGVAKDWRPKPKPAWRSTYARAHQLAGWILIPVALAAITGGLRK